ncbi:glycopeptide antibiotics resistance protein [Desulfosporosinus orientis DSM 765]|uniref:Glycopeptide antibiotics resistance protein n=2 Tax=Desulfosporosinus orientis TaxID=1563 RepID=G7W671_DESOD|nr:glycopeptide antibiotics resistance protein [Desulfosporosinus orientis DSM 765]
MPASLNKIVRKIAGVLFLVYFSYLLYRLFFFAYSQYFRFSAEDLRFNVIPFKTIMTYMRTVNDDNIDIWFFNLFGNVLAFMPMGFLLPLAFNKLKSAKAIGITTLLISSVLEGIQLISKLGTADIDDVILNTLGGLLGYLVLIICLGLLRKTVELEEK